MKHLILLLVLGIAAHAQDAAQTISRFFEKCEATTIRGKVEGEDVERCMELLTPSYKAAILLKRSNLNDWRKALVKNSEIPMKLPLTEGAIFTGAYEGGSYRKTESLSELGDRAYALVRIKLNDPEFLLEWLDLVIMHKVDGEWRIDDIISDIGSPDRAGSVRYVLNIDPVNLPSAEKE